VRTLSVSFSIVMSKLKDIRSRVWPHPSLSFEMGPVLGEPSSSAGRVPVPVGRRICRQDREKDSVPHVLYITYIFLEGYATNWIKLTV